jgi:acetoin utilization deacetylase AcuC-like enzyme
MQFAPDLIIVSAGFDAAEGDPIGGCRLTPEAFSHMTALLKAVAPLALVLEVCVCVCVCVLYVCVSVIAHVHMCMRQELFLRFTTLLKACGSPQTLAMCMWLCSNS